MKQVSKRIAETAKNKGYFKEMCAIDLIINTYTETDGTLEADITYQQLIEWVFRFDIPQDEYERQIQIKELEFWYNTLIPELITFNHLDLDNDYNTISEKIHNEFVLEGFIGMLLNWFEKNKYYFGIRYKNDEDNNKWEVNISTIDLYYPVFSEIYQTKQQARHEGILKCFKLMKEQ